MKVDVVAGVRMKGAGICLRVAVIGASWLVEDARAPAVAFDVVRFGGDCLREGDQQCNQYDFVGQLPKQRR